MNKQKGISQIAVMVIMLVLAVALPITTNLVKKSQENRSKAQEEYCGEDFTTKCDSKGNSLMCKNDQWIENDVCTSGCNPNDGKCNPPTLVVDDSFTCTSVGHCVPIQRELSYYQDSTACPAYGPYGGYFDSKYTCPTGNVCCKDNIGNAACEKLGGTCKSDCSSSEEIRYNGDEDLFLCTGGGGGYCCVSKSGTTPNPSSVCSSNNCSACSESDCSVNRCIWNNGTKVCMDGNASLAQTTCRGITGTVKRCVGQMLYTCISGSPQWTGGSPVDCGSNGCNSSTNTCNTSSGTDDSNNQCINQTGAVCIDSYSGMQNGLTCTGSSGGTNGGKINANFTCSFGKVCCVPNSTTNPTNPTNPTNDTYDFTNAVCVDNNSICSANYGTVVSGTSCGTDSCSGSEVCCIVDICKKNEGGTCRDLTSSYSVCPNNEVRHIGNGLCPIKGYTCCDPPYTDNPINPTNPTPTPTLVSVDNCTGYVGMQKCIGNNKYVNCQVDTNNYLNNPTYNQAIWWTISPHSCPTSPALFCTEGDIATSVCKAVTPTIAPTLICTSGEKRCSDNILQKCNSTRTGWETETNCGNLGCNSATKTCNVCISGNQKCTATNRYFTCNSGQWSTSTTNCPSGQICTNDAIGTNVCRATDYTAPSLNLFFAVSGVKAVNPCFGDLSFKVNVAKDGQDGMTGNVTATVVANKFNSLGDQVFKISNFALDNTYALTDKIKVFVSGKKTLATLYGKNNQVGGFGALNSSQILVSSLSNGAILDFSGYPVLNGDVGQVGQLGVQDGVVNAADFGHMKNQWGKTCSDGQNLEADLNGDCRVDTFDLQILKNANAEQYAQKTF